MKDATGNGVLAVVTNYKRPENVGKIVAALRNQTVPPTVVVVDNAPAGLKSFCINADDVWRFTENHGPPCRWAPALMDLDHKYTLFLDDDLLPGPRAVEACLQAADELNDMFATLGVIGRRFTRDTKLGYGYRRHNVSRCIGRMRCVDVTCRAHFIVTDRLVKTLDLRNALFDQVEYCDIDSLRIHDDILLCQSLQLGKRGYRSYLLRQSSDPEESLCMKNLPAGKGVSSNPNHAADRTRLINYIAALGWRSLV